MSSTADPTPAGVSTPAGTAGSLDVFSRRSSGLVRELSLVDVAWYGILAAAALFGLLYVFPIPQSFLPGLNVPVSALIAMVLMVPVFAVYAGLGSAMPRIGGDYLYQSRALHPAVGFAFTFAWEVFMWVTFTTTGGLVVATLGLQPLLYNLGLAWDSSGLISAADWFGGANGLLITTLVVTGLAFATTIRGMGTYRAIQRRIIVPAIVISNIVLIILLARSHESFLNAFNAFHEKATGEANFAAQVEQAAAAGGFEPPGFSLKYTLLFLSVVGILWYVVFAAQGLLGEAKQANNFGRLFRAFVLGGLYVGIVAWVVPTFLFQNAVGGDFMHAYAFAFNEGEIAAPAGATVTSFAMMMTTNPIVSILLAIGFIAVGFYFATCVFLNMTRVLTAMGMDRTLPEWFSRVSERFHAPINAAVFYLVIAIALNVLYRFDKDVQNTMIFGGAFTSVGVIAVTGLAAVTFAWRAKHVYEASPVAERRIFGLPLLAVCGAITFLAAGAVTVANLIVPELGFTTGWARTLLLVSLVVSAVWFFAYRAFLKRQKGINIDLAFRQVPPE
jgi:amino acid transporter